MGGNVVPEEYLHMQPWYMNLYENPSSVQFNHRALGITTFSFITLLWLKSRRYPLPPSTRFLFNTCMAVACAQVTLGVSTLLTFVDIRLAATHQAGSLTLLTVVLWLLHDLKRIKVRI